MIRIPDPGRFELRLMDGSANPYLLQAGVLSAGIIGLKNRIDHFPSQLSGGERLRVAVIRALMNNPKLLLADEPTGNLDIGNAEKLIDMFKQINKDFGLALIITTHNPKVAMIGSKQYILEDGALSLLDTI